MSVKILTRGSFGSSIAKLGFIPLPKVSTSFISSNVGHIFQGHIIKNYKPRILNAKL